MLDLKKYQKMGKDLQSGLSQLQEDMANERCEGVAGGGALKVVVDGNQQIVEIKIAPEAVDPDDVQMLEDLFKAAANQAIEKSKELQSSQLGKLTGGKMPNLPF